MIRSSTDYATGEWRRPARVALLSIVVVGSTWVFWSHSAAAADATLVVVNEPTDATAPSDASRAGDDKLADSKLADGKLTDCVRLSALIDQRVEAGWQAAQAVPAAPAGDGEFLRRVYLDLVGTIPPVSVARDFLEETSTTKRAELVDDLLSSPRFDIHFARVLLARLAPEATKDYQSRYLAQPLEMWLRIRVAQNMGYDKLVVALLSPSIRDLQSRAGQNGSPDFGPSAWYLLKEAKPENLASGSSRALLGLRIECAQCHDHPFDHWKRDQFWSYAAFFSGIERLQIGSGQVQAMPREISDRRELAIPGTGRVVQARYLDGSEPDWKPREGARVALAQWVISDANPYFARAMVNRTWAQLFGIGLVDPVDDLGPHNPASHPELLDELAQQFASHGYDVRFLMRAIVLSRPYQLSGVLSDPTQMNRRLFARAIPRGMSAKQLQAALAQATGADVQIDVESQGVFQQPGGLEDKFELSEDAAARYEPSILQALELMNGNETSSVTGQGSPGRLISATIRSPFMTTRDRIETLFLATLSRQPTPGELETVSKYVEQCCLVGTGYTSLEALAKSLGAFFGDGAREITSGEAQALLDVYWALLNSPEFLLNH